MRTLIGVAAQVGVFAWLVWLCYDWAEAGWSPEQKHWALAGYCCATMTATLFRLGRWGCACDECLKKRMRKRAAQKT